jgi:hypothetical protein
MISKLRHLIDAEMLWNVALLIVSLLLVFIGP